MNAPSADDLNKARAAGRLAARNGLTLSANPYPRAGERRALRAAWALAWAAEKAERTNPFTRRGRAREIVRRLWYGRDGA